LSEGVAVEDGVLGAEKVTIDLEGTLRTLHYSLKCDVSTISSFSILACWTTRLGLFSCLSCGVLSGDDWRSNEAEMERRSTRVRSPVSVSALFSSSSGRAACASSCAQKLQPHEVGDLSHLRGAHWIGQLIFGPERRTHQEDEDERAMFFFNFLFLQIHVLVVT
jgi:hypothetical protein